MPSKSIVVALFLLCIVLALIFLPRLYQEEPEPKRTGRRYIPPIGLPPNVTSDYYLFFSYFENGEWIVPQRVCIVNSSAATAWNQQRKVFRDQQGYYWAFGYEHNGTHHRLFGSSSLMGQSWSSKQYLFNTNLAWTQRELLRQGLDLTFFSDINKSIGCFGWDDDPYWVRLRFEDGTLKREALTLYASTVNHNPTAYRFANGTTKWHYATHALQPSTSTNRAIMFPYIDRNWLSYPDSQTKTYSPITGYATDTLQTLTLTWNGTNSVYVTTKTDYNVYWNWTTNTGMTTPPTNSIATLKSGIDTLSGCSEPEARGFGVGSIHIVYIKADGSLNHKSFNPSTLWSAETNLVPSGRNITSPVISADSYGNLLATFIDNSTIKSRFFNKATSIWGQELEIPNDYIFANPNFLSSSQIAYNKKSLLVWTAHGYEPEQEGQLLGQYDYISLNNRAKLISNSNLLLNYATSGGWVRKEKSLIGLAFQRL